MTLTFHQEDEDRVRQVEERRVIYIGRITEGTTKADLRRRFQKYGTIVDISVHFREHGWVLWNVGFVSVSVSFSLPRINQGSDRAQVTLSVHFSVGLVGWLLQELDDLYKYFDFYSLFMEL